MLIIIGAGGIVLGSAFAAIAAKLPAYGKRLEQYGGGLIIGGVAVFGLGFPML